MFPFLYFIIKGFLDPNLTSLSSVHEVITEQNCNVVAIDDGERPPSESMDIAELSLDVGSMYESIEPAQRFNTEDIIAGMLQKL